MSKIYSYTIYNLNVTSPIPFPELKPSKPTHDVIIRFDIEETFPNGTTEEGSNSIKYAPQDIGFIFENKPLFRVRHGKEIVINSSVNINDTLLRSLILGQGMGILLHQRGYLVLHGSAVNINGYAVAFLGHCGKGKSTTAAALNNRGHPIVTDDVLVISFDENNKPLVLPGFSRIKLHEDVIKIIKNDHDSITPIDPKFPKYSFIANKCFQTNPLYIKTIYLLENSEKDQITILTPPNALIDLIKQSYVIKLFNNEEKSYNLFQCTNVILNTPVKRLKICRSLDKLKDLTLNIEKDVSNLKI